MPTCPYCQSISATRRIHVEHLRSMHSSTHAYNIARSRNLTIDNLTQGVQVPVATAFGPVQQYTSPPSQINVPSFPWTLHCTVRFLYNNSWVLATPEMERDHACPLCTHWDKERCEHRHHSGRYSALFCRGGVCEYPHDKTGGDDRICDWGGRGRINNVYCRGHIPYLCPVDTDWLKSHFCEASIPPNFSTRIKTNFNTPTQPIITDDHISSYKPFTAGVKVDKV